MNKVTSLARYRRRFADRTRRRMHREQVISTQVSSFTLGGSKNSRPVVLRDSFTLLPFLNPRSVLPNIEGHGCERFPNLKQVIQRSHGRQYASDELSVQDPTMIPMTVSAPVRTISPMGRASTPARFRAEMAKRLSSARIVAGYGTKKQAAEKLGITLDRYEKWENGRTPVPAQYVGPVCELFHIDANYLFGTAPAATTERKAV